MSLFPVVSQVDAVDANYLTIKTAEGFLVHYHDLQRMQEPGASPTSSHPRARDRREPRPDRLIGCRQLRFQPPRETRVRGPKEKRKTKTVLFLRVGATRYRLRLVPAARVSPQTPSHRSFFNTAFDGAHVAAPYDLDGGNHAKTSTWNQIVRSPNRVAAFRSTTARLLPDPEGRIKSNFSRISENRKGLSFGSSSASGIIADHWRRTRGAATTEALGPGCYETPERDRFGNRIEGEIGSARSPRARSRRSTDGRLDAFHAPPRNRGTAAFAARTHRKQPAGRMAAAGGNRGDRGTGKNKMNWTI